MCFRGWKKVFFLFVLFCVLSLSVSFSFAADDLNVDSASLTSYSEENEGTGYSLDDSLAPVDDEGVDAGSLWDGSFYSGPDGSVDADLGDSPSSGFIDDGAFSDDSDGWVVNLEEDSRDDDMDFGSDWEPNVNPRSDPLDDRAVCQLDVSSFSKYYLNNTQLVGYLKDADDNPLEGKPVSICIANGIYNRTTNSLGRFSLNINLRPNNYTCNISFTGDTTYQPCNKTIMVKVFTMPTSIISQDVVKYYHNSTQWVARLLDGNGNPLANKTLVFYVGSGSYNRTTNDEGYARLNINFGPRVVNGTVNFTEDGYVSSKMTVNITVLAMPTTIVTSNVVKYYHNSTQWVARLLDGNGNPLVNKTLVFYVGSGSYNRTTNSGGYARLNINFGPRVVNGTVSFNEEYYINSNQTITITVLEHYFTNIIANNTSYSYGDGTKLQILLKDENNVSLNNKVIHIQWGNTTFSGTTDTNGKFNFNVSNMVSNSSELLIYFEGDELYYPSNKTVHVSVSKLFTFIHVNDFNEIYLHNKHLISRLTDGMHRPISNKTLILTVNNHSTNAVTDAFGNAYFDINLLPGHYPAIIQFIEDHECAGSLENFNITIDKANTIVNMFFEDIDNESYVRFVFMDYRRNVLPNESLNFCLLDHSGSVVFNNSFLTDDYGEIILSGNSLSDNDSVYVSYNGSDSYNGFSRLLSKDIYAPTVWASNGSGFYMSSLDVELNAIDDTDNETEIHYTLDGSLPMESSEIYSHPLHVSFMQTLTTLRFFAIDIYGHRSDVVNVYYFFGPYVANLNSGKYFDYVQDAIDDNDTLDGDIIEVNKNVDGGCNINKTIYLRSSGLGDLSWTYPCIGVHKNNSVIDGFNFYLGQTTIYLGEVSNCMICNNNFLVNEYGIFSSTNNFNNMIVNNNFSSYSRATFFICLNPHAGELNTVLIKGNLFNNSYYCVGLSGSVNSIVMDNVFYNSTYGLYVIGENSTVIGNNFVSNNEGAYVSGENAYIYDNNFTLNYFGLKLFANNASVLSNNIVNNEYGVYSPSPENLSVNFNRFASNTAFGLKVLNGFVNATNNWWGQNNIQIGEDEGSDVFYSENLEILYEPYIVLKSYLSYYEIKDNFVENVTCVADLNSNSFEEYVPVYGSLPDGFGVNFNDSKCGPYPRFVAINSGQAKYATYAPDSIDTITVILDNEIQELCHAKYPNSARFYVNTTAIVLENSTSLNVTDNYYHYDVIFNESVNWVSFAWRYLGDFKSEVSLVVDGEIVESYIVESSFYHYNPLNFSSNVFDGMEFYNDLCYNRLSWARALAYVYISLDNNLTTLDEVIYDYEHGNWRSYGPELQHQLLDEHNTTFEGALLSLIRNSYNLTDDEIGFIYENHNCCGDDISVSVHYYGDDNEYMYFGVDDISQLVINPAMWASRNGTIMYVNGSYAHQIDNDLNESVDIYTYYHNCENGTIDWENGYSYGNFSQGGYDGLLTYVFANDKVNASVLSYWLGESNRTDANGSMVFENGFMKAVYGTFLEGLLVIYVDDLVADVAAFKLDVGWERVSPMVMSVRDDHFRNIISGESSFYFGRKVLSENENVSKAFYFACSASFSPIEFYVHQTLFPGIVGGGVTVDLGNCLLNDGTLRIDDEGRYVYIFENSSGVGSCLCFDRVTGLFMDFSWLGSDAYCYSNQQTGWACDLAGELLDNSGLVWDYLSGNGGDIGVLNGSTQGLLKTCNAMGILSGLFGGACLSDLGVLIDSVGLEDSFASMVPLIGVVSSGIGGFSDYLCDSASDPHFWSGVVGGMLFEAGMIASCTGVGLPVGLALMGVGTVCTAYGSGLFGVDETGGFYTNVTDENLIDFGFSMGLNVVGGGVGASAAKSTLKKFGGEAVQVSISRAVYNADQRGAYTTFHTLSSSTYVRKAEGGSLISGGQYLVEEVVGTTTKENIGKISKASWGELFSNRLCDFLKEKYLTYGGY